MKQINIIEKNSNKILFLSWCKPGVLNKDLFDAVGPFSPIR